MRKLGRKWCGMACIGLMAGFSTGVQAKAATVPFGAGQSRYDVVMPDSWAIWNVPNGIEARENGKTVIALVTGKLRGYTPDVLARAMSTLVPGSTQPREVGKDVWAFGSGGADGKPVVTAVMARNGDFVIVSADSGEKELNSLLATIQPVSNVKSEGNKE